MLKEFIVLDKVAKEERKKLLTLQGEKVLNDTEEAKLNFLNLLFEMEQKNFTKTEFKKKINQLYSAHKNKMNHYKSEGYHKLNNKTVDVICNNGVLQGSYKSIKEFFNISYDFIAGKIYKDSIKSENWIYSLN